jgi:hypothetical protein
VGKRFRYSKEETVAEREEQAHIVFEKRDPYGVLQIAPYREMERERKGSLSAFQ